MSYYVFTCLYPFHIIAYVSSFLCFLDTHLCRTLLTEHEKQRKRQLADTKENVKPGKRPKAAPKPKPKAQEKSKAKTPKAKNAPKPGKRGRVVDDDEWTFEMGTFVV